MISSGGTYHTGLSHMEAVYHVKDGTPWTMQATQRSELRGMILEYKFATDNRFVPIDQQDSSVSWSASLFSRYHTRKRVETAAHYGR
jgi:hypothetical protein